jgi:sulfide:quinone oxidoreductase
MQPVALSEVIAVGEMPGAEQIEILAKAGFQSLINVQPEGEVERHLTSAQLEGHATKAGLAYRYVPVESRRPSSETVAAFGEALKALPRPIYACCYSGSRAAAAWALAAAPQMESDAVVAACAAAGYDITFMKDRLEAIRRPPAAADCAANGHAKPQAEAPSPAPSAVPPLHPVVMLPRAATAGGFAVAG